jgi:hypothetical protein
MIKRVKEVILIDGRVKLGRSSRESVLSVAERADGDDEIAMERRGGERS